MLQAGQLVRVNLAGLEAEGVMFQAAVTDAVGHIVKQTSEQPSKYLERHARSSSTVSLQGKRVQMPGLWKNGQEGMHHKQCGGWGETTQGFVEMAGRGEKKIPKGKGKKGGKNGKDGEEKKKIQKKPGQKKNSAHKT